MRKTHLFDEIVVAGEVGVYKPESGIFTILLERLRLSPPEALYIGDSHALDVVGAKRVGLWSAWLNRGTEGEALKPHPDVEFRTIGELREALL